MNTYLRKNLELVGSWRNEENCCEGHDAVENLYFDKKSGRYILYGNDGIATIREGVLLDWKKRYDVQLSGDEEYLALPIEMAMKWAAAYISADTFGQYFRPVSKREKILKGITPEDLQDIFDSVYECKHCGMNKEEFANNRGLSLWQAYPGIDPVSVYRLCEGIWDLCIATE